MNSDSSFLKALNKEILPTPPIWYMRQAGRYMPEYQNVRKKFKNFLDMCKEPDVCCELALQPINAFKLDAAILFSDILTIPDSFGLGVEFVEKEGPVFNNPINSSTDISNLDHFDPESLDYVYKAVKNIKNSLSEEIPLIGFCGSPWTLAAYSIEGRSSKDFEKTLGFLESNQKDVHDLFVDTGMGSDAYSVIELKMIESILSQNPTDRRTMIDEASGINNYNKQRAASTRRLISTKSDMERIYDIMSEVETNVKKLKARLSGHYKPYLQILDSI